MNITQSTSQSRPTNRKAVIGGGWITTPAVAAHVRQQLSEVEPRAPQPPVAGRKALTGGGWITAPAVAAHMRQTMPSTTQR